ncbi:toll-Interleukin receptor [Pseudoalteromonas ruthenica]|uniref:Toll-Interleukin receptor n=1 Tax=Pseudoalteromonas ruthenica TaxID=151081 RepID=A0A5S3Z1Q5_9GAMM|nr:toll/interleukin-1 receptor domain-containing protein [Pseudoalteromonas ruthenica]TMP85496.1 toll-Interleukin receptor [Pseudoalteromonas ruthenica]
MAYFTKQEARRAAQASVNRSSRAFNAKGRLTESLESTSSNTRFDVFLSHSIDDAELVLGVKELLEEEGLTVYVDWDTDKHLSRDKVNKETAELLRVRLRQSKSLIYIATDNSSNSKWMPWELGFFDGYRPDGVAVLPLLDSESETFVGQEYLSLYPTVSKGQYTDGKKDIFVKKYGAWKHLKGFGQGSMDWRGY